MADYSPWLGFAGIQNCTSLVFLESLRRGSRPDVGSELAREKFVPGCKPQGNWIGWIGALIDVHEMAPDSCWAVRHVL